MIYHAFTAFHAFTVCLTLLYHFAYQLHACRQTSFYFAKSHAWYEASTVNSHMTYPGIVLAGWNVLSPESRLHPRMQVV